MKKNFAINGFGRIGRTTFRIWWEQQRNELNLETVNTSGSMPLKSWVHLLKYDSNYGHFDPGITIEEHQSNQEVTDEDPVLGLIKIADHTITVTAQRDPAKLPWEKMGIDVVLEATGHFLTKEAASAHLTAGAKKVLLSAPGKSEGISTSVRGVVPFDDSQDIFSNASCTTNCVAPIVKILEEEIGLKKAVLSTIHAYTASQNLLDNSHKDLRRARAAAVNVIPTTTGAAKATTQIIPELTDLFDGMAFRVPLATGSVSDLTFVTNKKTDKTEVNQILTQAAQSERWQGVLAVSHDPITSSDIVGRNEAAIVDLEFTQVIADDLVKVIAWYDNEWGYCVQLLSQLKEIKL